MVFGDSVDNLVFKGYEKIFDTAHPAHHFMKKWIRNFTIFNDIALYPQESLCPQQLHIGSYCSPHHFTKNEFEISQFLLTSLYIFREVCAPNNCALAPGEEVCRDESRMQMQNVPEEDCDLQPEETCHMEAVLVPRCVHIYFRPVGTFRGSSGFVRSNFVK